MMIFNKLILCLNNIHIYLIIQQMPPKVIRRNREPRPSMQN